MQYMGLCGFSLSTFLGWLWNVCTSTYYHNLVKNMNHYPLIKFRLCNNGMRCMSCKVLTDKAHKYSATSCEIALRWMQQIWWHVGLGIALVPSGNNHYLNNVHPDRYHLMASIGHNMLISMKNNTKVITSKYLFLSQCHRINSQQHNYTIMIQHQTI